MRLPSDHITAVELWQVRARLNELEAFLQLLADDPTHLEVIRFPGPQKEEGLFLRVPNPNYSPDNGQDPYIVVEPR